MGKYVMRKLLEGQGWRVKLLSLEQMINSNVVVTEHYGFEGGHVYGYNMTQLYRGPSLIYASSLSDTWVEDNRADGWEFCEEHSSRDIRGDENNAYGRLVLSHPEEKKSYVVEVVRHGERCYITHRIGKLFFGLESLKNMVIDAKEIPYDLREAQRHIASVERVMLIRGYVVNESFTTVMPWAMYDPALLGTRADIPVDDPLVGQVERECLDTLNYERMVSLVMGDLDHDAEYTMGRIVLQDGDAVRIIIVEADSWGNYSVHLSALSLERFLHSRDGFHIDLLGASVDQEQAQALINDTVKKLTEFGYIITDREIMPWDRGACRDIEKDIKDLRCFTIADLIEFD